MKYTSRSPKKEGHYVRDARNQKSAMKDSYAHFDILNFQAFSKKDITGCVVDVTVKRTSGHIEHDWLMCNYVLYEDDNGKGKALGVKVLSRRGDVKHVRLADLYEHNPDFPQMLIDLSKGSYSGCRPSGKDMADMKTFIYSIENAIYLVCK